MSKLFSPATVGSVHLRNRMVMAPMTRSRAIGNVPNEMMAEYYGQRAEAGLIVTEGTSPSPNGLGYARIPGIFNEDQIKGWAKTTFAVHERGGKIFLQLMHTGRVGHPANLPPGATIFAPSAVAMDSKIWTDTEGEQPIPAGKEMTPDEIRHTIAEYITGATNAISAGFDGVELHGANGYFIEQFLNPASNQRTDEFGGTIEKRSRFLLDIIRGTAAAIGKDRIGIRLSPYGVFNEMPAYPEIDETYDYLSKQLYKAGIAYIHLVDHSSMGAPAVPQAVVKNIRKNFRNVLILSGGYDVDQAEDALEKQQGDLIAFGRPFLSNPDLVKRYSQKFPLNAPRFELFYTPGAEGYTDYPVFDKMKVL